MRKYIFTLIIGLSCLASFNSCQYNETIEIDRVNSDLILLESLTLLKTEYNDYKEWYYDYRDENKLPFAKIKEIRFASRTKPTYSGGEEWAKCDSFSLDYNNCHYMKIDISANITEKARNTQFIIKNKTEDLIIDIKQMASNAFLYETIDTLPLKFDQKQLILTQIEKDKMYAIKPYTSVLGDSIFKAQTSLTNINVSPSLKTIGEEAFSNCVNLKEVTTSDSLTSIEGKAFYNCTALTKIELGKFVSTIGANAFKNCITLSSITLTESLKQIERNAFYDCIKLKTVYCYATTPPLFTGESDNIFNEDVTIYVHSSSLDEYKANPDWGKFTLVAME